MGIIYWVFNYRKMGLLGMCIYVPLCSMLRVELSQLKIYPF